MYAFLKELVPSEQLVVVHSDLGEVEWRNVQDHIRSTIKHPLHVVRSHHTFFGLVRHRAKTRPDVPSFPSAKARLCTATLKRAPIQKFIRHDTKARGKTLAVSCMGLRAEESSARAKRPVWSINKALTTKSRTVYDWLPIHDWTTAEVFDRIAKAGQKPFWAYAAGNKRLSCVFCILPFRSRRVILTSSPATNSPSSSSVSTSVITKKGVSSCSKSECFRPISITQNLTLWFFVYRIVWGTVAASVWLRNPIFFVVDSEQIDPVQCSLPTNP